MSDDLSLSGLLRIQREEYEARIRELEAKVEKLQGDLMSARDYAVQAENERDDALALVAEALKPWVDLACESHGVTGFHLNGDVAEWDELDMPSVPSDALAALEADRARVRREALREATDHDLKQQARIRELEAELEACRKYRDAYRQCDEIATAHVRRLEAENAALREGRGAKPLPRREGVGDWTLRMDLLSDLNREVQSEGWDSCTAEVTEIIALSVERRILSALSPAPVSAGDKPEEHCAKCGAPRSNHRYRHPFVPRALLETEGE